MPIAFNPFHFSTPDNEREIRPTRNVGTSVLDAPTFTLILRGRLVFNEDRTIKILLLRHLKNTLWLMTSAVRNSVLIPLQRQHVDPHRLL